MLIGSFGASAVLAFGAINSPLAQSRNLVGGATALIALSGGDAIYNLGYLYAPALYLLGAAMMLFTGCIANNISAKRRYPLF